MANLELTQAERDAVIRELESAVDRMNRAGMVFGPAPLRSAMRKLIASESADYENAVNDDSFAEDAWRNAGDLLTAVE